MKSYGYDQAWGMRPPRLARGLAHGGDAIIKHRRGKPSGGVVTIDHVVGRAWMGRPWRAIM